MSVAFKWVEICSRANSSPLTSLRYTNSLNSCRESLTSICSLGGEQHRPFFIYLSVTTFKACRKPIITTGLLCNLITGSVLGSSPDSQGSIWILLTRILSNSCTSVLLLKFICRLKCSRPAAVICLPEIHLPNQDLEGPHSGVTTTVIMLKWPVEQTLTHFQEVTHHLL